MSTVVTALTQELPASPAIVTATVAAVRSPLFNDGNGQGTIVPKRIEAPGRSVGRITRLRARRICAARKPPSAGAPVTFSEISLGTTPAGGRAGTGTIVGAACGAGIAGGCV